VNIPTFFRLNECIQLEIIFGFSSEFVVVLDIFWQMYWYTNESISSPVRLNKIIDEQDNGRIQNVYLSSLFKLNDLNIYNSLLQTKLTFSLSYIILFETIVEDCFKTKSY